MGVPLRKEARTVELYRARPNGAPHAPPPSRAAGALVAGAPEEEGCARLRDGSEAERESFGARRGESAMSRHTAQARTGPDRMSLYDEITTKIITELEAGHVPWVQPWGTARAVQRSILSLECNIR
jgi:hypothetical protein